MVDPDDPASLDQAYTVAYAELRRMAAHLRPGQSVTPTTLVHEAYTRMVGLDGDWTPLRLKAVAARAMRSVLIDRARRREADKRGGGWERVTLRGVADAADVDVLALHDALIALQGEDPTAFQIVELRFFGGLTNAEVAELLDLSLRTVERRWRAARALLRTLMEVA